MADMTVGEVDIELDGKTVTLKSTLAAAKRVNAAGGLRYIAERLDAYDFDAYVTVIAAGADKRNAEVEQAVFSAGMARLQVPLGVYIAFLASGGKPIDPPKDGAPAGEA